MIRHDKVKVRSCHVMSGQYKVRSGKLASQDVASQVRLGRLNQVMTMLGQVM